MTSSTRQEPMEPPGRGGTQITNGPKFMQMQTCSLWAIRFCCWQAVGESRKASSQPQQHQHHRRDVRCIGLSRGMRQEHTFWLPWCDRVRRLSTNRWGEKPDTIGIQRTYRQFTTTTSRISPCLFGRSPHFPMLCCYWCWWQWMLQPLAAGDSLLICPRLGLYVSRICDTQQPKKYVHIDLDAKYLPLLLLPNAAKG